MDNVNHSMWAAESWCCVGGEEDTVDCYLTKLCGHVYTA